MNGVPAQCLNWCRGLSADVDSEFCALTHARQISSCFDDGRFTLPSPPRNIRVKPLSANSAMAQWDPPAKNAEKVELYRILYREQGSR